MRGDVNQDDIFRFDELNDANRRDVLRFMNVGHDEIPTVELYLL